MAEPVRKTAHAPALGEPQRRSGPNPAIILGGQVIRIAGDGGRRAEFWRKAASGGWEDVTLRFVCETTDETTTFVDIGAWIGPLSLVAAGRAKRVIAIEPDPVAVGELRSLVTLNNAPVEVWHAGIDGGASSLTLFAKTGFGDTMTSSLGDPEGDGIEVPAVTFADISSALAASPGKVVVKMDVEVHEFQVAEQLAAFAERHRAYLTLSLHPAILCRAKRRTMGSLRARWQTFRATLDLVSRLNACGSLILSKTGEP